MFFLQLLLQEGPSLKSKGKASIATRIAVLTWRSLLIMSREWKYYWLRLILYMLLTLCIGTVFSGLGHSLSSVGVSFITWTPLHCKHNRCWFELVIQPLRLNSLNFLTYVITLAFTCFILFYLLNFFFKVPGYGYSDMYTFSPSNHYDVCYTWPHLIISTNICFLVFFWFGNSCLMLLAVVV